MKLPRIISRIFGSGPPRKPGMSVDHARFGSFTYLWNNSFGKEPIHIGRQLNFSKYFGFNSKMDYVLKLTGKPSFVMENRPMGLDILVYMQEVKGNDVRFELHFHEGILFFISYTYFHIPDIERENVIRSLCEKFGVDIPSGEVFKHILIDSEGNGLLFEQQEHFSVNYLAPSSKVSMLSKLEGLSKRKAV